MKNQTDSSTASHSAPRRSASAELLGVELHDAAIHGYKKKLKKLILKGK